MAEATAISIRCDPCHTTVLQFVSAVGNPCRMSRSSITIRQPLAPLARGVVAIAAIAAIATPVVAATDAAAMTDRQRAQRTNVYVQGDSLTVGSSQAIRRKLRRSVNRVWVDARIGRHASTGLARTKRSRAARRSRVWVMALGTNDAPSKGTVRRQVRQSLKASGKKRDVVWVTIQRPGKYGRVNRMLRRYAKSHPRLHIVDWARYVKRHPRLLARDRVHATHRGYDVRAAMIARKARHLARTG